ncbi:MAG: ribosome maturation factor RimP [candidate division NC10 bacterium]|jgi:ribosome maturation factor RimP|nr:ribosome maturation factor RimP [candidate division NC10 bacterium]
MVRPAGQGSWQRRPEVVERIRTVAEPILAERGLELVEVEFQREGRGWILRLYMDRAGGVTLGDCQQVSEELGDHLDVEDLIDHPYHLEVSSPGLDRPLTREADFLRYAGKAVRITTHEAVEGQRNFRGRLAGLEDGMVLLDLAEGRRVRIPRGLIAKARLEIEL